MNALINISNRNLLNFGSFEDWVSGVSSAPTDYTLSGASAAVAQEATIVKRGIYSAKVTRSGADSLLYNDLSSYASYLGRQMTFGAWVYATVASRVRLQLSDSVGTSNSSYHTGDSTWQFLTVTRNIDTTATRIRTGLEVNTGNTSGYIDGAILVEGASTYTDMSQYFETWKPNKSYRMSKFVTPRKAGTTTPSSEHDSKTIAINGTLYGATPTLARTAFDAMLQALNGSEKDLYLYDDRYIKVFLESEDHDYVAALRGMKFNLHFYAQSPFEQSFQKYRNQQTISASPTTFTLTSNGNIYTKPKIRFTTNGANITSCTIENLTTGQLWSFTGTVINGNYMEVDFDLGTVLNNGVDAIQYSVGDFPQFQLNAGANQIKFTGSNCIIAIDYFDRWL